MSDKKTKDELLVENAVLKYNEQVRKMLKEELSPMRGEISEIKKRVDISEDEIKEIKDIIEPFAVIRKRFWLFLIVATLSVSVVGNKLSEMIASFTEGL